LKYRIRITDTCLALVEKIPDKKIQRTILDRIEDLSDEPDKQGKRLVKDLSGFRSIHVAGRYRIIYKIDKQTVIVYILAAGIRKKVTKKTSTRLQKNYSMQAFWIQIRIKLDTCTRLPVTHLSLFSIHSQSRNNPIRYCALIFYFFPIPHSPFRNPNSSSCPPHLPEPNIKTPHPRLFFIRYS
jgi:mRNA interferase RelE/StbE